MMKKYRSDHFLISDRASPLPERNGNELKPVFPVTLQFAVPKKLLKRAVDRNAVRRVARESWRMTLDRSDRFSQYFSHNHELRIRLLVRPQGLADLSRPARKKLWRAELDRLFGGILK